MSAISRREKPPESSTRILCAAGWPRAAIPIATRCPQIPSDIILETARLYIDAFESITSKAFELPSPELPILDRIRANLAEYF